MELPDDIYNQVEDLSAEGSDLFDQSRLDEAIQKWSSALNLLPTPQADWGAYTWLSASIGDAQYQMNQLDAARHSFLDALNGPDGLDNPFIHYRLGQILIRLGEEEKGIQSLLKAYMLDGEQIFSADPDGASYLQKLRDKNLIN